MNLRALFALTLDQLKKFRDDQRSLVDKVEEMKVALDKDLSCVQDGTK